MEADWSVEIGRGLPCITIPWDGFIDLGHSPAAVQAIEEAIGNPALRKALMALNSTTAAVLTTKCDIWTLTGSEIDPDEFGASAGDAVTGFASYIDILQRDRDKLESFEFHERWVRSLTHQLRAYALSNSRVEFVVRPANIDSSAGFGITLYAAGCGADESTAYASWEAVLCEAVTATMNSGSFPSRTGE